MRVLAIGAHPDDLEILCGGTLARFRQQGDDVVMCHVANGNLGHTEIPRDELRQIRREEAKRAAAVIGAESVTLDIDDMDVYLERSSRAKMVDVIRRAAPDVIIVPSPDDYLSDHFVSSQIAVDASFLASLPQLVTEVEVHFRLTPIFFADTLAGVRFDPEEYVDISAVEKIKREMIACHESQARWLKEHDQIDYVEFAMKLSAFRGVQCGVAYAEAFRLYRVWGRIPTKRYLPG
ncbi:MAG: PIG-L family deacetylase [Acidobacteria bacterium]|nr:MAG: PIG-L family deacetylase [Acidobacteriota bacterium]